MSRTKDKAQLRRRFHVNPTQLGQLLRDFTQTFIDSHIEGGSHVGPVQHRAPTNERVPQSTVIRYGDAVELGHAWRAYLANAAAGSTPFTPHLNRRAMFTYNVAMEVVVFDNDADATASLARIVFARYDNDEAPADRRIHHLDQTLRYDSRTGA